jgi:CopG antitoxin of type II toxin-antitoxin system
MAKTMRHPEKIFTTIHSLEDIPSFASEDEEAAFWSTHELSEELLANMGPIDDKVLPPPRTRPVSLRFDEYTLERARALARKRHIGYQTLMKEFITERLYEEEKREGLVGERHSGTA